MKTTRRRDNPLRKRRRLLWITLAAALIFELAYGLGGRQALEAQIGDLSQLAAATGATGYYPYDCPGGCDDGNSCTNDSCVNGACTHTAISCNDGNACTQDSCQNGSCINEPIDCDDGNLCNGTEFCDPGSGSCQSGTPIDCDDGNPCTDDSCDPLTGGCLHTPAGNGRCCDDDGNDCTKDICMEGACVHPEKDNPSGTPDVQLSFSKQFSRKEGFLGLIDVGFGSAISASASVTNPEGPCSLAGDANITGTLNASFVGESWTLDVTGNGNLSCSSPIACTQGCNNRKECDESQKCCQGGGGVTVTLSKGWEKRFPFKGIGSAYIKASLGGGLTASGSKSWPHCDPNELVVNLGPTVVGSLEGAVEVCNGVTRWICGCRQGRDKWTGQFQTACSDCSRCTPYASLSANGSLAGGASWHDPGGMSWFASFNGCVNFGGIKIGPIRFDGYATCLSCAWPTQGSNPACH
ncbi:MAG TPA: hypothetical protein PK413_06215 [Thermoanaerobaculia bacterium]|nr:hypothetical protein [Thermoanaerobaculia bacterium]